MSHWLIEAAQMMLRNPSSFDETERQNLADRLPELSPGGGRNEDEAVRRRRRAPPGITALLRAAAKALRDKDGPPECESLANALESAAGAIQPGDQVCILLLGGLDCGFRAVGPFRSAEEAHAHHAGGIVMRLEAR